jgi:hypothetical protein
VRCVRSKYAKPRYAREGGLAKIYVSQTMTAGRSIDWIARLFKDYPPKGQVEL